MEAASDSPIRITLVITEIEPGGAERALVELARRLDPKQFVVRVVVLSAPPARERQVLLKELEAAQIETTFLGARRLWHAPRTFKRLKAELRTWQPEIVQSFLFHANALSAITARSAGVPHLVWGTRVADREHPWHLAVLKRLAGRAGRHVCVSEGVATFMRDRGFPADRLVSVPNGIDLARIDRFQPVDLAALGLSPGRRAIAFVGRLEAQKGADWLLGMAGTLLGRLPEHDLVVVGSGPQEAQLRAAARQADIGRRVHFLGWRGDVPAILKSADLLVLPSRWEGMPNVLLEAMACGIPAVATRVEGVAELLGPHAEEQTADRSAQAFCDKVVAIASDRPRGEQLGRENRLRAEHEFSLERTVAAYERLYRDLARGAE